MASLKDIRTRINSVKSTQKITRAMKLVSAAKFAKASHAVAAARPYGEAFDRLVEALISSGEALESKLLQPNPLKKTLVVVVATDRGLCGGLNTNLFKKVKPSLDEQASAGAEVEILAIGRRAASFSGRLAYKTIRKIEKALEKPTYLSASELSQDLVQLYLNDHYQRIIVAYPRFQSALAQEPTLMQFLPVALPEAKAGREYIVEPSRDELIDDLLERKLAGALYRVFLEAAASEHGARMSAMDSATNNAKEVIKKLTLKYNRARQAAITTELTEIISGAESLN